MDEFWSALWKTLPAILSTFAGYLVYKLKQVDAKRELEAQKTQKLLDTIKLNLKGTRTALQCILDRYHHEAMQQGFTTTRQLRHFSDVYRIYESYAKDHPDRITAHYMRDMETLPIREDVAGEYAVRSAQSSTPEDPCGWPVNKENLKEETDHVPNLCL